MNSPKGTPGHREVPGVVSIRRVVVNPKAAASGAAVVTAPATPAARRVASPKPLRRPTRSRSLGR
jgi:hypothetical protein